MTTPYNVKFRLTDRNSILKSEKDLGDIMVLIPGLVSLDGPEFINRFGTKKISDTEYECEVKLSHPHDYDGMIKLFEQRRLDFIEV
jgi:hypothetical protein